MTVKRFKNVGSDIFQYNEWYCSAGGEHCAEVITEALNTLTEENEELKKENQSLKEEKELLKNKLDRIEDILPHFLSCAEISEFRGKTVKEDIALMKCWNKRYRND